jgi:hypothetical protein
MRSKARAVGVLVIGLVLTVGPVLVLLDGWNGGHHHSVVRILIGAYLVVLLGQTALRAHTWLRNRARERNEAREFAQFLAEKRQGR